MQSSLLITPGLGVSNDADGCSMTNATHTDLGDGIGLPVPMPTKPISRDAVQALLEYALLAEEWDNCETTEEAENAFRAKHGIVVRRDSRFHDTDMAIRARRVTALRKAGVM